MPKQVKIKGAKVRKLEARRAEGEEREVRSAKSEEREERGVKLEMPKVIEAIPPFAKGGRGIFLKKTPFPLLSY
jgi:hypothetical protein